MTAEEGASWASSTRCMMAPGCSTPPRRWRAAGRRPDLRAWRDQEAAASGMEHGRGRGHRGRGRGPGICMQTRDFHRAMRLRRQAKADIRRKLKCVMQAGWTGLFEERHRVLAHEVDAWCERSLGEVDHHDADAACRKLVKAMGEAGWLRYAVAGGPGGAWAARCPRSIRARSASCAKRLRAMKGWRTSPSPCRAWAAARSR